MHEVLLFGGLREVVDGAESVQVEGATIREVLHNLSEQYPPMRERISQGIAVAIDGTIYRDDWEQPIPEGAEVGLLSRIAGG